MGGGCVGIRTIKKTELFAGASLATLAFGCYLSMKKRLLTNVCGAALILSCWPSASALAANYTAGSLAELQNDIALANTNNDPNPVITLTASFTVGGNVPNATGQLTINSNGFTLFSPTFSGGTQPSTLSGTGQVKGGDVTGTGTGNTAFTGNNAASVINDTTVVGGNSTGGSGGIGALLLNSATLTNKGTVKGGNGATTGGLAAQVSSGSTLINEVGATIQGGNGSTGGVGVNIGTPAGGSSTLTNNGIILGGAGATVGGAAVVVRTNNVNTITNTGTIEGGNGAVAILTNTNAGNLSIINSGTITAGTGANAIQIGATGTGTGTLNLELRAGSVINGNVVAGAGNADTLALGGAANAIFDVSTIGAQYLNFNNFQKTGTGTWALTGTGTTTTNWDIQDGMLAIGNGGTSGSVVGAITNNATLAFNRSDVFTFDNLISGSGTIRQIGSGTTILTADNSTFSGNTFVEAGTLSVNGILGGTLDVLAGGRLQGNGQVGTTSNAGIIAPGNSIGTLTVNGNYTGNGGTLEIETALGDDTSPTDRLVVSGNTSGTTNVKVINLGGAGAQTVEGIKIIDIGGVSAGTFSLLSDYVFQGNQAVVAGAYAYRLYQNGISTPTDGDWYLRSALLSNPADPTIPVAPEAPLYQPGVPLYEAYPQLLLSLNGLSTLQQRLGDRYWSTGDKNTPAKRLEGFWLRTEGTHARLEPDTSTSDTSYDYDLFKLEGGLDSELYQDRNGRLIGGFNVHYGTVSGNISSVYGDGDIHTNGYGVGTTLTWYGENGFYVDTQGQATWYDSNLKSDLLNGDLENGNNGFGYALSLETGKRFAASGPWSITPQAQLIYSSVNFDSFNDRFGARVSLNDGNSLIGRLGVALDREENWRKENGQSASTRFYGAANLYSEFLNGTSVDVAGAGFKSENDRLWAGLTLGGSYDWNQDRFSLYGEVAAKSSLENFGDSYAISGTAGLRVKW